ncbi:hypothetical protein CspeluHIS016_0205310 [Cutaneotrichosporon spelunceum]|uniref:Small ribosomal subunit protein mS38 n=1 Tax=Cutaneotrichosporon spelunceum TaxID=1672016 RepID=A0AAD3Y9Z2_9TREE|nr:hypothetical protein CspeluHIS016_0205310 [Cutaneotrichosporon spelunceum]
MFRRLYSTLPEVAPRTPRGRSPRPVRTKCAVAAPRAAPAAAIHGRRLRRGVLSRTDLVSTQPAPDSFQPIALTPLQTRLHLALTPSHMPLPLASASGVFDAPPAPSALFEPAPLRPHVASAPAQAGTFDVASALDAAAGRHATAAQGAWDAALARMGAPAPAPVQASASADATQLADALAALDGLLARLDTADTPVHMDSVKRKRKKKMNKHKYKKRRKATRAIRKRLGK